MAIYVLADQVNFSEYVNSPRIPKWAKQKAKLGDASYNLTRFKMFPKSNLLITSIRRKRQTVNSDFTWKVTKTPKFVTAKTEKHPEPVLRVYPPDAVYRSGRSRDFTAPQRSGGRRVIYYATLPEVVRYPPNTPPVGERYTNYPTVNQQRSFATPKGGKEFVTRVQSTIIDVRPRGENRKEISSTPTFTIIDANPTSYSGYPPPYNRIQADFITNLDKPSYNYLPSYYNSPKNQYEILPQNVFKAHYHNPYSSNTDKSQYPLAHYQYQQQSNPYFYNDIGLGKIPSQYYSPPYPSRHTRFPTDRYPITSPLSHFDIGIPPTSSPALSQSHSNFNQHNGNFHSYQPSLGYDSPSTTFSSPSPSLDFNSNFGTSLDHGLDFDDHHTISPLKDKFLDYNSLSQKYFDFNGFNDFAPLKYDNKDTFKFDKEPFKGPFSQVSDWLTNKPFDLTSLDFDDPTSNRDYQTKGSAHSVVVDSQVTNQNLTTTVKDSDNTIITPFTSSNSSSVQDEGTNTNR